MPTDGPSDRIYSYLCLRFRYFARQNADKFTLHAAFSAPLQEDSFTMKAGLRQIPIQGAAPRLAGNREWDGLPMPTRFWAILAVAFGVSLSVIDGAIANVALPTMARMLGISSANSIWIVNAYQLAIVVSLLSFSALGDVIGYRKIYIGDWVSSSSPHWAARCPTLSPRWSRPASARDSGRQPSRASIPR